MLRQRVFRSYFAWSRRSFEYERASIKANSGGPFKSVIGYIVADDLAKSPDAIEKIQSLRNDEMFAQDWNMLLEGAKAEWRELMDLLVSRAPQDERLKSLTVGESAEK